MKVCVGAIVWRQYEPEHFQCLMGLLQKPDVIYVPVIGDALVERARSIVATYFLESTDADVLLTIDSDIWFRPDDALLVSQQAMTHDIVSAVYATRSASHSLPTTPIGAESVSFGIDPTPVPVRWAASGFMAIHRRVLEKLRERPDMAKCHGKDDWAFHPFYHTRIVVDDSGERNLLSEDYAFCERAREEGFGVHINPAVRLGHVGSYIYRLEDMIAPHVDPRPLVLRRENGKYKIFYRDNGQIPTGGKRLPAEYATIPNRAQRRGNTPAPRR
jgi:hypothetical protein